MKEKEGKLFFGFLLSTDLNERKNESTQVVLHKLAFCVFVPGAFVVQILVLHKLQISPPQRNVLLLWMLKQRCWYLKRKKFIVIILLECNEKNHIIEQFQ